MQTSIVSIVSDGASVMKKLGKICQLDHQLCDAHGVHLAVCDLLHKNRSVTHIAGEDYDDDQDEECLKKVLATLPNIDPHNSMKQSTNFQSRNRKCTQEGAKSGENISEKSRENEILQKYVLLKQKKELSLDLDCKTRWSSMYEMVERFICLKKCISKALLDLSIEHGISTTEFLFLNKLIRALESIKLTGGRSFMS